MSEKTEKNHHNCLKALTNNVENPEILENPMDNDCNGCPCCPMCSIIFS